MLSNGLLEKNFNFVTYFFKLVSCSVKKQFFQLQNFRYEFWITALKKEEKKCFCSVNIWILLLLLLVKNATFTCFRLMWWKDQKLRRKNDKKNLGAIEFYLVIIDLTFSVVCCIKMLKNIIKIISTVSSSCCRVKNSGFLLAT